MKIKKICKIYIIFCVSAFNFVLYQKNKIRLAKNARRYYNYKD